MKSNYEWQNEAKTLFLTKNKLVAEVVTGAGKTHFAINCLKDILTKNPSYNVLIVSPKIVILQNWQKELLREFSLFNIGLYYGELKDYAQITLTTTNSIVNMNLDIFDVLIVDELHNSFTPKWKNIYSKNWKYLLGLTATLNNDDSVKHWEFLKYFDYNIYRFTMKQALQKNIINNFDFYNYAVFIKEQEVLDQYNDIQDKIKKILQVAGSFNKMMRNPKLKALFQGYVDKRNKLIYGYHRKYEALKQILVENKGKKTIIFNQLNEISRNIYLTCLDNDLSARVVNSDLDKKIVDKRIKEFEEGRYNIMITSKMFDEGYNLPELDIAIIFSGDSTKRQVIQRIGRVLRKKETKSTIYQVFCIDTFEEDYAEGRYKLIKDVVEEFDEVSV